MDDLVEDVMDAIDQVMSMAEDMWEQILEFWGVYDE